MSDDGRALSVRRAERRDVLDPLIEAAYARALAVRGGVALLEQLWGSATSHSEVLTAVARCVAEGDVWVALEEEQVVGGALVHDRCVQVVWVQPDHRRRRVASAILLSLLNSDVAPVDAWALPGDRATKSLYESVGWKARLLTMRGA
jgi:GNAT superfamily N-acetyltransferase